MLYGLIDFKSIQTGIKSPVFEEEYLKELASTIIIGGVIIPPVVVMTGIESYEIVSGHEIVEAVRYLRDTLKLNREYETIPCIIIKDSQRKQALLQIAAVYDII